MKCLLNINEPERKEDNFMLNLKDVKLSINIKENYDENTVGMKIINIHC